MNTPYKNTRIRFSTDCFQAAPYIADLEKALSDFQNLSNRYVTEAQKAGAAVVSSGGPVPNDEESEKESSNPEDDREIPSDDDENGGGVDVNENQRRMVRKRLLKQEE